MAIVSFIIIASIVLSVLYALNFLDDARIEIINNLIKNIG